MAAFVAKPRSVRLAAGPLILLLDGLWNRFGNEPWVLYQIAVRPCSSQTATFLDPILIAGKESSSNWERVLEQLPSDIQARTVAVVVDNLRGMKGLADARGWALQLCHFHLLMKFFGRQRMIRHAIRGGPQRILVHQLARRVLTMAGGSELEREIFQLKALSLSVEMPARIRASVRELLASLSFYRTYLTRPLFRLPNTTNTVESMGARIRAILDRHKAASSPKALLRWATALTRLRPEVACKAENQQI